jgi:guanylate kinase
MHYFFISKEEFEQLIKENSFLEYACYSGNYYGTNKKFVDEKISEGKSVLLEIELQGALQVMEKCPEAITIFIKPPTFEELEKRLRGRHSEDEETILKRLEVAKEELNKVDKFSYVIENKVVEEAVDELIAIYNKETK